MSSDDIAQQPMPPVHHPDEISALTTLPDIKDTAKQAAVREEEARPAAKMARRMLNWLFKLVLFMLLMAALIGAIYFGWPILYTRYILPVQTNTDRITVVESDQQSNQVQLSALQTQLPDLATVVAGQSAVATTQAQRIATMEGSFQVQAQALASAQAEQAAALTAQAPRVVTLESAFKAHDQALAALESTQASLQAADIRGRSDLEQEVARLKSMELLSRARLFLYQSNYGLAKQDVQSARSLLAGMLVQPDHSRDVTLTEVVERLDLTLSRLPDFPVAASDDLDIAWQILLGVQAEQLATSIAPSMSENTPTPTTTLGTPVVTPTATP